MRPYAIYEHPDFTLSNESVSTLQRMATALTVVAASGAAVYNIINRVDIKTGYASSLGVHASDQLTMSLAFLPCYDPHVPPQQRLRRMRTIML